MLNRTHMAQYIHQALAILICTSASVLATDLSAQQPPLVANPSDNAQESKRPSLRSDRANLGTDNGPSCSGGMPPPIQVRLSAGKSTLVNLAEPITRRTLGDPAVVDGKMVSPQILYLVSGRIGSTNAILQGVSGRCVLLDISVAIDTAAVMANISELMPKETGIRVSAAADSIVLSGVVSDAISASQAVEIANAYVRAAYQQGFSDSRAGSKSAGAEAVAGGAPLLARVVNMLSVKSGHQVMLEVKVAEISKTVLDKLGSQLNFSRASGAFTYRILTDFLSAGAVGGAVGALRAATGDVFSIDAEKRDGLVRILAEPNVMAISGQEGSFLAGGAILIPVGSERRGGGLEITLEEKEFGVGLKFTPTVLSDGRINLKVAPEVSELSREGIGISNSIGINSVFPLITTRRASTTVQLYDGQSFAIGGLMKSSTASTVRGLPGFGQIPILGALFRSTEFQTEQTELVFIVTPRLVKPLPPDFGLPTDLVADANRTSLMLLGKVDSAVPETRQRELRENRVGGMILK